MRSSFVFMLRPSRPACFFWAPRIGRFFFRAERGSVRRNPSSSNCHIIVRTVCDRTKVRYFASYKCLGPER
jgi:hypothetical protein